MENDKTKEKLDISPNKDKINENENFPDISKENKETQEEINKEINESKKLKNEDGNLFDISNKNNEQGDGFKYSKDLKNENKITDESLNPANKLEIKNNHHNIENENCLNHEKNTINEVVNNNLEATNQNIEFLKAKNSSSYNSEFESKAKMENNKGNEKNNIIDENGENYEKFEQNENNDVTKDKGNNLEEDTIINKEKIKFDNEFNNREKTTLHLNIKNDGFDESDKEKNNVKENNESSDSSSDDDEYNGKYYFQNDSEVCGMKNLGNNCYLNSGLQILASCEELVDLLQKDQNDNFDEILTLFKNAMITILNRKIYNPKKFINCFCKLNRDFIIDCGFIKFLMN